MTVTPETASTPDELVLALMTTPAGKTDPYPWYRRLREWAPIHRSELGPLWYLTRFDDCHSVLRDQRLGKAEGADGISLVGTAPRPRTRQGEPSMLFLNPPDHTRLRGLVSRGFTPRRVERLRPHIAAMVDEMLDDMADHDTVDAIGALAFPLPSLVISELVGVPIEDRVWLREPISKLVVTLEPSLSDAQYEAAAAAAPGVYDYFVELVAKRRAQPTEDLISALIAARDGDDRLTEGELLSTVMLLFVAGFETTTNLIGNGLLALLRHPDQLRLLCADPGSIPNAVEEILRYDSPVQLDARTAFEAVELADGHVVEPGDLLVTLLGAANRDPAKVADPERFDVTRNEVPLISFATGIHYCLGASLARLEGAVVFERLLARFPNIELAESEPPWLERLTLRGLERLPVSIGAVA